MTRDEAIALKVGDLVSPHPLWNRTEWNAGRKISDPTEVIRLRKDISQTGIMVTVQSLNGAFVTIDAGWFEAVK